MTKKTANETTNTDVNAATTPSAWAPSCANEPVYTSPPWPTPLYAASRGAVNRPQVRVPQMPQAPWEDSAPIGSSSLRSIAITHTTTRTPAISPMGTAAQYSTEPDGAVMATRPAITPLPVMPMSKLRVSA